MPKTEFAMDVHAQRGCMPGTSGARPGQKWRMWRIEWKLRSCPKLISERGKHVLRPLVHQVVFKVALRCETVKHGRSGIADQNQRATCKFNASRWFQPPQHLKALGTDARFNRSSVPVSLRQSANDPVAAGRDPV